MLKTYKFWKLYFEANIKPYFRQSYGRFNEECFNLFEQNVYRILIKKCSNQLFIIPFLITVVQIIIFNFTSANSKPACHIPTLSPSSLYFDDDSLPTQIMLQFSTCVFIAYFPCFIFHHVYPINLSWHLL